MKKMLIAILIAGAFLASGLMMMPAFAEGQTITHTDPTGDVSNDGLTIDVFTNVDITGLTMNAGSELITFDMTFAGLVYLNNSDLSYSYYIYIDHDDDGDSESDIWISMVYGIPMTLFTTEYGDGYSADFEVSGNGTNTLHVEIPVSLITGSPGITDIYGSADVMDGYIDMAEDYINEDFGMAPVGDDDDETDDDDWDDDWDDDYETEGDPTEDTATDDSISVSIDDAKMDYEKTDDTIEMELNADGKTSGDVLFCAMTTVTYMADGTYETDGWDIGPEEEPQTTFMGVTYAQHFKGTGSEGEDDWSEWSFYVYMKSLKETFEDLNDEENDVENVTKVVLWCIRVFSDEGMTMWNQDTEDITSEYLAFVSGEKPEGDGDSDDLPGFELFGAVIAFAAVAGIGFAFRRRR